MLEDGKLYRPARRRLQPDSMHRNYLQREPFMYGVQLSDCLPRKRHTVYRERPLQESLVSSLVNRKRPPLPRERPISRSMVADFLHRKREREKRPEESYHPQDVFGSKGSSLNRRCKSAPGRERREREACSRPSTGVSIREEFSIIRALIDEVLPKEKEKTVSRNGTPTTTTTKQHRWQESQSAVAKLVKGKLETKAVKVRDGFYEKDGGRSPLRSWPVRPASAPFKLSPQNMTPDDLAETLATKKRSFLRKRPATAPPPRPMFHLPLSRINNPRRSSTPKPADCAINRKASVGSSSSKMEAGVKAKALPSSPSLESSESESRAAVTTIASSSKMSGEKRSGRRKFGSPDGRRKAAIESICGDSDDDDSESKSSKSSSSSSSTPSSSTSSSSSDSESETSSSTLSSFIEWPTPSTLDSIDEWLRNKH